MVQAASPASRLQPATIALAAAGLIALGVLVYTLAFRGDGAATTNALAVTNTSAGNAAQATEADEQAAVAEAEARIRTILAALRTDPDNHQAWFELGWLYRAFNRVDEAAQAFRRAAELQPANALYANHLGEMLLIAATRADRPITEAERYFRRGLQLQPGNAMSRFYLATIKDARGDHRGAIDDMIELLRNPPSGEPLPPQVRSSVMLLAQRHNIDISSRLPPEAAAPSGGGSGAELATSGIPGPSQEQLSAASGMTPTQQSEMGRGMVERLAGRLRQNPRDAPRWIMMMRSRMALNEPQLAAEALRTALATFQGDAATQAQLRDAARALGVPGS